jgi:DNA-binding beta-propeller fold protein YncE
VGSQLKTSSLGSNVGRGESRRSFRHPGALAALLVTLLAAACLLPASASAIEFRTLTESFGPDGDPGPSGNTFEAVGPLAFDQGSSRFYALDQETHKIHGFGASTPGSHPPLGGSFPLTEPTAFYGDDLAVDSSSHDIYLANAEGQKLFGYDENGAPLPGFPIGGFGYVCGVQVDSAGNVWAADAAGIVNEYSPGGALIFATGAVSGTEPCRFAIDDEDNLYITGFFGPTKKYTAATGYNKEFATEIDPEVSYGITIDRLTNELYVAHYDHVSVYDENGAFLYEFGAGGEYGSGIAIDEATEEVYVSDAGKRKVDVFGPPLSLPKTTTEGANGIASTEATVHGTINPRGLAVEDCHFEVVPAAQFISTQYAGLTAGQKFPCEPSAGSIPVDANPHAVDAGVTGLEPATTYHYRLAGKNSIGEGKGLDRQFTTGPTAPLVEGQSVQASGVSEATLSAKINPRGGKTTYHVEYGATNVYGQSSAESAPFGFASDNGKHTVSVHIGGLEPGTVYHFRFVATNEVDTTEGADASFATYPASPTFAPCPDEEFRTGAGARLPDCRAYEQGTPIDKHGSNAQLTNGAVSASGDRFTFFANGGLPTTGGLSQLVPYLASRGSGGWGADGLLPVTRPGITAGIVAVNEDLSAALVTGQAPGGVGEQIFLRDSETATFQPGPANSTGLSATAGDFSADPSHIIFWNETQLLPSAPAEKFSLYELDHGALALVDRVPAGSGSSCDDQAGPACVVPAEGIGAGSAGRISRDGSRVFFTVRGAAPFGAGRIYLREDGAKTTWISASQRATPDPEGEKPAKLVYVTPDGSKAFFLSCEKLTDDSTAHSNGESKCVDDSGGEDKQGQDLYSYDVGTGELTDLTVDSADPLGAAVQGFLGASDDGSYAYFVAKGALAPGASASPTTTPCSSFAIGCNLYSYHDGVTKFIARTQWSGVGFQSRVATEGGTLLFESGRSLTGYDNHGTTQGCGGLVGSPCTEFFRYSTADEELLCVSCVPTRTPPTGQPGMASKGSFVGTAIIAPQRNLSADGNRVFFESPEAMVPGDTNGVTDVYEWEAKGAGSCESESQNGGCVYLISSGSDPENSTFLGASRNGDHVFFFTEAQLVPTDEDQLVDVYDAGVGAGLTSQHALAPPTCAGTACQANPASPLDPSLASAAYAGPGNVHRAAKGRKCPQGKRKVRRGGKVRCQKARRHRHKRHHDRGGSK